MKGVFFATLRTAIDRERGAIITAHAVGVGIVGGVVLSSLKSRTASISSLFVAPRYRRRGIARSLLEECCDIARRHKCAAVNLTVQYANKSAQGLYIKTGFSIAYQYDSDKSLMFARSL